MFGIRVVSSGRTLSWMAPRGLRRNSEHAVYNANFMINPCQSASLTSSLRFLATFKKHVQKISNSNQINVLAYQARSYGEGAD